MLNQNQLLDMAYIQKYSTICVNSKDWDDQRDCLENIKYIWERLSRSLYAGEEKNK